METNELQTKAVRQVERIASELQAIRDDVKNSEFDGARSYIEIMRGRIAVLDEILLEAAFSTAHD